MLDCPSVHKKRIHYISLILGSRLTFNQIFWLKRYYAPCRARTASASMTKSVQINWYWQTNTKKTNKGRYCLETYNLQAISNINKSTHFKWLEWDQRGNPGFLYQAAGVGIWQDKIETRFQARSLNVTIRHLKEARVWGFVGGVASLTTSPASPTSTRPENLWLGMLQSYALMKFTFCWHQDHQGNYLLDFVCSFPCRKQRTVDLKMDA